MIRFSIKHLVAALGLAASASAFAVPVTVDIVGDNAGTPTTFRFGTETSGAVEADLGSTSPSIGEFATTINNITGLFTFCLELEQDLNTEPTTMDLVNITNPASSVHFTTGGQISRLNRLFGNFYDDASLNATNAAAFQLLLWEVKYDGQNAIDLGVGDFFLDLTANYGDNIAAGVARTAAIAARDIALGWVSTVNSNQAAGLPAGWILAELRNTNDQDLIIVRGDGPPEPPAEVPEPGSLALLGLGALAFARKRK